MASIHLDVVAADEEEECEKVGESKEVHGTRRFVERLAWIVGPKQAVEVSCEILGRSWGQNS